MTPPESALPHFRVSTPACVALFGEHQALLGLPEILLAGGPRLSLSAVPRRDRSLCLVNSRRPGQRVLSLEGEDAPDEECALLRAAMHIAAQTGASLTQGYDLLIEDSLPRSLRAGRNAALAVSWTVFLFASAGRLAEKSGGTIAAMAHRAQSQALGERAFTDMTYGCALGGLVHFRPAMAGKPARATALQKAGAAFVLGELPAPLPARTEVRRQFAEAVTAVRRYFPHFDLEASALEEVVPFLADVGDDQARVLYALLSDRDACRAALEQIRREEATDADVIGELLDQHHEMLRDHLGLVSPEEDALVSAARAAGAAGAKANTRDGGSIIAFAPGCAAEVSAAVEQAGATAHAFDPGDGMTLDAP